MDWNLLPSGILAVVGVDDAVVLGAGALMALVARRRARLKTEFLKDCQERIERENELVAENWRSSNPKERKLVIERTFRPPGFLAPKIRIKEKFRRNPRPWYKRLL
jgi:hypothetical protein